MKKLTVIGLALFSALLCYAQKPNVLFIAVDDLNDWAGYRGHSDAITPNMDGLAEQGVWFSRAYCQYALCGPSRATVMSGVQYHTLEMKKVSKKINMKDSEVAEAMSTLDADLMHTYFDKHGYKTMAVGKILHRHVPDGSVDKSGGRGGWDHNEDADGKGIESNWKSDKTLTDWAYYNGDESEMSDSEAASWAVERLESNHKRPFFLMVGFLRPHVPWHTPKKHFDMYDKDKLTLPEYRKDDFDDISEEGQSCINSGYPRTEWAIENDQWRNIVHAYLASITFADAQIGRVLAALEKSEYRDNTIVVLWSDHGYHMGEKNTFQKHTLWERSARTPLIIKAPAMKKGARCDRNVQLIDLYPTLVDLCGLPENDDLQGRSLKPLLEDPDSTWDVPAFTVRKDGGKSVKYGSYRFIEYGDGTQELYNHEKDPHEWTNLAGNPEHKTTLQMLKAMLPESW